MTKMLILSASLIVATCGNAFAYSNVSPREASHVTSLDRHEPRSFDLFDRANSFDNDAYRYHGGPKEND